MKQAQTQSDKRKSSQRRALKLQYSETVLQEKGKEIKLWGRSIYYREWREQKDGANSWSNGTERIYCTVDSSGDEGDGQSQLTENYSATVLNIFIV